LDEIMRSVEEVGPRTAVLGTGREVDVDGDEEGWEAMREMDERGGSIGEERSRFFGRDNQNSHVDAPERRAAADQDGRRRGRTDGGTRSIDRQRGGIISRANEGADAVATVEADDQDEWHVNADQDSQKENRPVPIVVDESESERDERPATAPRRPAVVTRSGGAGRRHHGRPRDDIEYREVIELSD
jgi:hypothetical protein